MNEYEDNFAIHIPFSHPTFPISVFTDPDREWFVNVYVFFVKLIVIYYFNRKHIYDDSNNCIFRTWMSHESHEWCALLSDAV